MKAKIVRDKKPNGFQSMCYAIYDYHFVVSYKNIDLDLKETSWSIVRVRHLNANFKIRVLADLNVNR